MFGLQSPSRLKYEILIQPKNSGGVGLLHLERYYQAAHLTKILDHCHNCSHKLWIALESAALDLSPISLPWVPPDKHPPPRSLPFCIVPLLRIWDSLISKNDICSYSGPLTLVLDNPAFPVRVPSSV